MIPFAICFILCLGFTAATGYSFAAHRYRKRFDHQSAKARTAYKKGYKAARFTALQN